MDKLKDFINKNLDAFNLEEPSPLHFQKFEEKLNADRNKSKSKKTIRFISILSGAAAILFFGYITIFSPKEEPKMYCGTEVYEVASFYSTQLESKLNELKDVAEHSDNKDFQQNLLKQVNTLKKESDFFLNNLCSDGVSGENKILIVNTHYVMQIQAIEQLLRTI